MTLIVMSISGFVWSWSPAVLINRRGLFGDAATAVAWTLVMSPVESLAVDEAAKDCDEACREKRLQVIRERRAMMRQSRSTSSRQEIFDLSTQRAALYNATYQGASCPPGLPCL